MEEELEMLSEKGMKSVSRDDVMNMLHFAMSTNLMVDSHCNIDMKKKKSGLIKSGKVPEISILKKPPGKTGNMLSNDGTRYSSRLLKNVYLTGQATYKHPNGMKYSN